MTAARILIIEDHPPSMEMMTFLLESFGYSVEGAVDGEQGVEKARRHAPDLVVCDIHLPRRDGYEVVRELKAAPETRDIPVIAVTALAMVGDREKLLRAGFDDYVSKPIEPTRFLQDVADHLPERSRAAAREGAAGTNADKPRSAGRGARILVVDDSPVNRELIRDLLEPFGHEVVTAQSVEEGRRRLRQLPFDLIVSDLHMPNENGIALLREMKADPELTGVPFVFLTASYEDEPNQRLATEMGVTRSLRRPIEPCVLLAEIEACLPPDKRGKPDGENPCH